MFCAATCLFVCLYTSNKMLSRDIKPMAERLLKKVYSWDMVQLKAFVSRAASTECVLNFVETS